MIYTALYQTNAGYTGSDGWSWYTLFRYFAFAFASLVSLFAYCMILNIAWRAMIYPPGGICTCVVFFLDFILVVEFPTDIDICYFRWHLIWIALLALRYVYGLDEGKTAWRIMKKILTTFGSKMRIQYTYISSILTHLVHRIVPKAAIGALPAGIASVLVWLA